MTAKAKEPGVYLKVQNAQLHGKGCRVWIDGQEMTHAIRSLKLDWDCQNINTATVEFLVNEFDADTRALLVQHTLRPKMSLPGWLERWFWKRAVTHG